MSAFGQIISGGALLGASTLLHVGIIVASIPAMAGVGALTSLKARPYLRISAIMLTAVFALLFAHMVQIWCWALTFLWRGLFDELSESFYFATVTYTTLGYGDIVLDASARIFATFAAIAGLFTFGISTAFLLGLISRLLPDVFGPEHD